MKLRQSQLPIQPTLLSTDEEKAAIEKVNKAVEEIGKLDTTGKIEVSDACLDIVSDVGGILRKTVALASLPLIEKLKELWEAFEKFNEKTYYGLEQMKYLVKDVDFYKTVITPTILLSKFMEDSIKSPGPETTYNFKNYYQNHTPVDFAFLILNNATQGDTNPFKAIEDAKRSQVLDIYDNAVIRVAAQHILLESFAGGLLKTSNKFNIVTIKDRKQDILDLTLECRNEKVDSYWAEMKVFLEDFLKKNAKLSNVEKSDEIQKKLEGFTTTDSFYVCVFNESIAPNNRQNDFTYQCRNETAQLIKFLNSGESNVFIYRSFLGNSKNELEYRDFKKHVEMCRDQSRIGYVGNIKSMVFPRKLQNFALVVHPNQQPEIRHVKCPERANGPGHWIWDAEVICNGKTQYHYLVSAFE